MATLQLFRNAPEVIAVAAGKHIFRIGEAAKVMYLIIEGEVDLMLGDTVVETAGEGVFIGEMALIDDELFGEDRELDRDPDCPEIGHRAAEPMRLAEDRDRGSAAGLVGAGENCWIGVRGDCAGRWRAAFDLGDQMQAGLGQALGDGPRRVPGRSGGVCGRVGEISISGRAEFAADVGQAPLGNLGHDAGTRSGAGSGAGRGRHAGMPSSLAA